VGFEVSVKGKELAGDVQSATDLAIVRARSLIAWFRNPSICGQYHMFHVLPASLSAV
jgi:hypothetical protein